MWKRVLTRECFQANTLMRIVIKWLLLVDNTAWYVRIFGLWVRLSLSLSLCVCVFVPCAHQWCVYYIRFDLRCCCLISDNNQCSINKYMFITARTAHTPVYHNKHRVKAKGYNAPKPNITRWDTHHTHIIHRNTFKSHFCTKRQTTLYFEIEVFFWQIRVFEDCVTFYIGKIRI